jgi:hypothetical protein
MQSQSGRHHRRDGRKEERGDLGLGYAYWTDAHGFVKFLS